MISSNQNNIEHHAINSIKVISIKRKISYIKAQKLTCFDLVLLKVCLMKIFEFILNLLNINFCRSVVGKKQSIDYSIYWFSILGYVL